MDPITNPKDMKYHLGKFYFQKGDFKKASNSYQKELTINPHEHKKSIIEAGIKNIISRQGLSKKTH